MDIPAISRNLSETNVMAQVNFSLMKGAIDQMKDLGDDLSNMMEQTAMPLPDGATFSAYV